MRNIYTLNVRGFSLAASLLWVSSGCFTHSDFSLLPPSHLFFFLWDLRHRAAEEWGTLAGAERWLTFSHHPPVLTHSLCGKNTNTEAVLTWLSQAALEPLKCKLPLRIVPRLLDAKSLSRLLLTQTRIVPRAYFWECRSSGGQILLFSFFFFFFNLKIFQGHWLGRFGLRTSKGFHIWIQ